MSSSRTGQLNYKEQVHYSLAERVFVLSEPVTNKKGETVIIFFLRKGQAYLVI